MMIPNPLRQREYAASELARARLVWEDQTNDEINDRINEALYQNERHFTTAIYALLGAAALPMLYRIFLCILAGFRKSAPGHDDVRSTPKVDEAPHPLHRPPADYYPVIARAVSRLTDNTLEARQTLYDRARMALTAQLDEHDQLQIDCEQRALEATTGLRISEELLSFWPNSHQRLS